jgi:hypothetical protein
MATEQDYYTGSEYGSYPYVTLKQVVNDYMASRQKDDYDALAPRHVILNHARRGMRELYMDVSREVRAIEIDVSDTLSIPMPPDYIDYVRVSWVDKYGNLYPITENKSLSISRVYLQDHEYNILFDNDGNVLYGSAATQALQNVDGDTVKEYDIIRPGFTPNQDRTKVFENGSFVVDREDGLLRFDSTVHSKSVVLEYISDGLYTDPNRGETDSKVRIHKYAESALHNYIYWQSIAKRRNVPRYAVIAAKNDYYNSKRVARRRLTSTNVQELLQAARGADMWAPKN